MLVLLSHLHSLLQLKLGWLATNGGWIGVQLFFTISGYLIIRSAEKYPLRQYALHRFFRIWPAYIFWFIAFGLIFHKIGFSSLGDKSLYPHLALMQHFFPVAYLKYDILNTSWTLTVEVVWYVLAFILARAGRKFYLPSLLFSVVLATWWIYSGKSLHPLWGRSEPIWDYFFITNIVIAQLPFFMFGCVMSMDRFKLPIFWCAVAAVAITSSFDDWSAVLPNPIFLSGLASAAALYIALNVDFSTRSRVVKFFSDTSYSMYLLHFPVIVLVAKAVDDKYLACAMSVAVISLLSWLSYKLIETPFIRIGRDLGDRFGVKQPVSTAPLV